MSCKSGSVFQDNPCSNSNKRKENFVKIFKKNIHKIRQNNNPLLDVLRFLFSSLLYMSFFRSKIMTREMGQERKGAI